MPYGGTPDHIPVRKANNMQYILGLLNSISGLKPTTALSSQQDEVLTETSSVAEAEVLDLASYGAIV